MVYDCKSCIAALEVGAERRLPESRTPDGQTAARDLTAGRHQPSDQRSVQRGVRNGSRLGRRASPSHASPPKVVLNCRPSACVGLGRRTGRGMPPFKRHRKYLAKYRSMVASNPRELQPLVGVEKQSLSLTQRERSRHRLYIPDCRIFLDISMPRRLPITVEASNGSGGLCWGLFRPASGTQCNVLPAMWKVPQLLIASLGTRARLSHSF